MSTYAAPVEDILFSLEHIAEASTLNDFDLETHREIASHFAAFAEGVLAPLNGPGDREGASLVNGRVHMPSGFKAAYDQYCAQGWPGLSLPEKYGGQGLGDIALAITSEIFAGANHAFEMTTGLMPGAARTLLRFGTKEQRDNFLPRFASGDWLTTMALSEPGAGSDLSRIRCRARRTEAGWKIDGEKIFISGGDQNLSAGILHLVLARTSDEGLDGLSLFLCLSDNPDGQRNGISVTRIEEKLGIHASPTCQLRFEDAHAELIGDVGQGLSAMFTMMNHARLSVALQGVAHAAQATTIARRYADERIQGKGQPIAQHADVAWMLDEMDLRALGARGIAHLALVQLEKTGASELIDVLTPIAKYHCTEVGSQAADFGIQALGGYGYLEEYGLAQLYRDVRITRIYEGTNGIHALALATRHIKQEKPLRALDDLVSSEPTLSGPLEDWRGAWRDMRNRSDARPVADAFMRLTSELVHQFVWVRFEKSADHHGDPERILRLYRRAVTRWKTEFVHYCASHSIS